ncbi:MAG TPA: glycosyltransferase family 1 protein [Chloroflexia bacterium]|nr:glycosyltransferase family 1 protein [Chloroflexia bacterium]
MAKIVVCGYMVRFPVAGNVLAFFSYVLGLCRLGHQVVYLEESGWPSSCYDPVSGQWHDDPSAGLRVVRALMSEYDLPVPVLYVDREASSMDGGEWGEARRMLEEADLLLNVGGVCWLPEFSLCKRLALVDMDPLFTQAGEFGVRLGGDFQSYHALFSYGANIGLPGCTVPLVGADWLPTVPPVVPEMWDDALPAEGAPFTTVANWSAYGAITYGGEHYGQKDEEFMRLLDLPSRTSQKLELALSGVPEDLAARLRSAGWLVRDANRGVNMSIQAYQSYIRASRGELSVAKHAYVKSRSGWFSDRSVCYLAAGLPVVLQDTGFSDWLPTGEGVLAFSSAQEAAMCIERVNRDYRAHRNAAREIAEQTFSYKVVLPRLLDRALSGGKSSHAAAGPGDME